MRLVLSADFKSIFINEGYGEDRATPESIASDTRQLKSRITPGKINPRTNRGVRLGMSRLQVQRILGTPKKSMWSKRFRAQEIIYSRHTKLDKEGMGTKYTNYYLFRADKLYFIELSQDAIGGG